MKKADPGNKPLLDRLSQDVIDGMKFFNRAIATQTVMLTHADKVSGGPAGIEMREEAKAGERARALEEKVTPNCRMQCSGCGAARFGGGVCYENKD